MILRQPGRGQGGVRTIFWDMEEISSIMSIDFGAKIIILKQLNKFRKNADKEKRWAKVVNILS
jgi:hypothetical protein